VEQHFGRIDGLVNNAARFSRIDPLKITETDWDSIHDVNLKATTPVAFQVGCIAFGAIQVSATITGRRGPFGDGIWNPPASVST